LLPKKPDVTYLKSFTACYIPMNSKIMHLERV